MLHRGIWAVAIAVALAAPPTALANEARHLPSGDDEIIIELATDDYSLEEVAVGGESYVRVHAEGYDATGEPGLPSLPMRAVLVGVPFGARLSFEVLSADGENLGVHRVLPVPAEDIEWDGEFALPTQRFLVDEEYYARGGAYPSLVAELGASGTLRHQRVARVVLHPFQYSARTGTLTLHRRIVVRVRIEAVAAPTDLTDAVVREPEWERTYSRSVLNHEQAAKWRMRPVPASRSARLDLRQDHDAYRLTTYESGVHLLNFSELASEGLDSSTPVDEVAVYQRSYGAGQPDPFVETPLAIAVEDVDDNGYFDGADYLLFHARSFEQQHLDVGYEDRYGTENAYWFARDADLAVPMVSRPGWLDAAGLDPPASFRDTLRYEEDVYFDARPDFDYLDLYYWTNYLSLGDNYQLPFRMPDVLTGGDVRMRARYQGMTSSTHVIDFRVVYGDTADNWLGQFSFSGVSANMNEDIYQSGPVPSWYFGEGDNVLRAIGGSRSSGANLDWFEFQYDREYAADGGRLSCTNAGLTGVSEFEVAGLATDAIRLFDVGDPFATEELELGAENISGGAGSYTLLFQDDVGGFTRYEAAQEGSYFRVDVVERREPANLWSDEADVIFITYDSFAGGVEPLISHRESEGWVVARSLTSDIYDEFGGGLKSLEAIRDYVDYAFTEWARAPQFVVLVGDASEDTRGLSSSGEPDFIPTFLGHGSPSYPQMTASDQWFISSDEGPMYLPRMFIGRLSIGNSGELETLVSKTLAYENYGAGEEWRNNVYFLADDQWHYGTAGGTYSWDWGERRFTTVCLELADMVSQSPAGIDTTIYALRRYTDAFHASNGITTEPQSWSYFAGEVLPYVLDTLTPELVDQMSEGAVIVNFQGHGNRTQMTHEQLFQAKVNASYNDVLDLTNDDKPFIFLGFSCHLSQFHSYSEGDGGVESIVEQMLFRPSGRGAVAGFACSGAAYLGDNTDYNADIFQAFFTDPTPEGPPDDYSWPRWTLGSILGEGTVKFITAEGYSTPARTYVLLGDPLLHLEMTPPTIRVTLDGDVIFSGEYLEASAQASVEFVVDIIDEVEIDPASIVVEDFGGVVPPESYTVEAVGDTLSELGRWYRVTYETTVEDWSYDIRFSATDMNGQTTAFVVHVAEGNDIIIFDVANHPNPFATTTKLVYHLNQSGADVRISIYTVGGRLIRTIDAFGDLNYNEVGWDGVDQDGDVVANGLYLYVIEATGDDGTTATTEVGRMVKAR